MKNIVTFSLLFVLLLATVAFAAPATLTGTLSDTMCAKSSKHMMPGQSDADCIRACVKAGAKWALVGGGKVYVLDGDKAAFDKLAGKRVTVTGEVNGENVSVKQIAAAK